MITEDCVNLQPSEASSAILAFILEFIDEHEEHCTYYDLETAFEGDIWPDIHALIAAGKVFVAVPLSKLEYDSAIMPITWRSGLSRTSDIEAEFREPHAISVTPQGRVFTYDLFEYLVDDDYPTPPEPYDVREAADENRPDDCAFFYTNLWPPEALQIVFTFDTEDVLLGHKFQIGTRCASPRAP